MTGARQRGRCSNEIEGRKAAASRHNPVFAAAATLLGFALAWLILRKSASDSLTSF